MLNPLVSPTPQVLQAVQGDFLPQGALTTPGNSSTVVNAAKYYKIGRLVYVFMDISFTKGTGTGTFTITGLPFSGSSGHAVLAMQVDTGLSVAANQQFPTPWISGTTLFPQMQLTNGTAAAALTAAANLGNTCTMFISGTYLTDLP